MEENLSLFK